MHIVDELIEERCARLRAHNWLWPMVKPALYAMLDYRSARSMADAVADMSGNDAFAHVSSLLAMQIEVDGVDNIPATGRTIIIGNHPTGLADGIAVFDALRERRPDLVFLANADALRAIPNCTDLIIPVEWVKEKRSRETARRTLAGMREAMQDERALVIFPSGALANWVPGQGLVDKPWETSAVHMAAKHKAPIIPMHMGGRNSVLFYLLSMIHQELRDITLFHELLNKKRRTIPIRLGEAIAADALSPDVRIATQQLRTFVTQTLANRDRAATDNLVKRSGE